MKTGLTLTEMAIELERRANAKRDFIADTRELTADDKGGLQLHVKDKPLALTAGDTFRRQVSTHYKIPHEYAERVRGAHPDLWQRMLNTHFQREPARRMVRTLDGTGRAFLSDRYRPLDDYDLAQAVLPEIMAHQDMQIVSSQFTESRFYLKALFPKLETEIKKGDVVQIGLAIANSEVGASSLQVMPLVYRLICLNGMISEDYGQKKYHVGKRAQSDEAAYELYTDKTKALDDAAFFAKVRDTVKGVLTREVLEKLAQRMRDATEQPIAGTNIQGVVEVTAKAFGYGEGTKAGILRHLITGGDLSRYGLMNAITAQSQEENDYDVATQLEKDGARLIELPQTDWKRIADVALAA